MGLVAGDGPYSIHVHSRKEHPPPHCHVYLKGYGYLRVNLLTLELMDPCPKGHEGAIKRYVKEHFDEALNEWERLNG